LGGACGRWRRTLSACDLMAAMAASSCFCIFSISLAAVSSWSA
jgi:hypothetical protein